MGGAGLNHEDAVDGHVLANALEQTLRRHLGEAQGPNLTGGCFGREHDGFTDGSAWGTRPTLRVALEKPFLRGLKAPTISFVTIAEGLEESLLLGATQGLMGLGETGASHEATHLVADLDGGHLGSQDVSIGLRELHQRVDGVVAIVLDRLMVTDGVVPASDDVGKLVELGSEAVQGNGTFVEAVLEVFKAKRNLKGRSMGDIGDLVVEGRNEVVRESLLAFDHLLGGVRLGTMTLLEAVAMRGIDVTRRGRECGHGGERVESKAAREASCER